MFCRVCEQHKDGRDFYPGQVRKCGTVGECKDCTRARVIAHRAANDNVRAYDRERSKTPERQAHNRRNSKAWRKANPLAYKAHTALNNAVRDGKVFKQPCAECGANDNLHAHHADYSRPLDVTWYCARHHHLHHAAENAA